MNRQKFEILADAYGGKLRKWPAKHRILAVGYALIYSGYAKRVLAQANALDFLLGMSPSPTINSCTIDFLTTTSPKSDTGSARNIYFRDASVERFFFKLIRQHFARLKTAGDHLSLKSKRRQRLFFLGVGVSAACTAGIVAGILASPLLSPDYQAAPLDPYDAAALTLRDPNELDDG